MERSKAGTKIWRPKGLNYSSFLSSPVVATPRDCGWISQLIYTYSSSTTSWEGNINEHNMVIFYKTWKKCNEIQVTRNEMDLHKSKMKNIKAWLEMEPNFPGVATPQSKEWIICIISSTYYHPLPPGFLLIFISRTKLILIFSLNTWLVFEKYVLPSWNLRNCPSDLLQASIKQGFIKV